MNIQVDTTVIPRWCKFGVTCESHATARKKMNNSKLVWPILAFLRSQVIWGLKVEGSDRFRIWGCSLKQES